VLQRTCWYWRLVRQYQAPSTLALTLTAGNVLPLILFFLRSLFLYNRCLRGLPVIDNKHTTVEFTGEVNFHT